MLRIRASQKGRTGEMEEPIAMVSDEKGGKKFYAATEGSGKGEKIGTSTRRDRHRKLGQKMKTIPLTKVKAQTRKV